MVNVESPSSATVSVFLQTFGWQDAVQMEETGFGVWYEQEWFAARCGIARYFSVVEAGTTHLVCIECYDNPIVERGVAGQACEEHVFFSRRLRVPICVHCDRGLVNEIFRASACPGCLQAKYIHAAKAWERFQVEREARLGNEEQPDR